MRTKSALLILCFSTVSVVRGEVVTVEPVQPGHRVFPPVTIVAPPIRGTGPLIASLPAINASSIKRENRWVATVGVVRQLPAAVAAESVKTSRPWIGTVFVEGAAYLRLRIRQADIDGQYWVCGTNCSNVFTSKLAFNDELWTPTVEGDKITLISDTSQPKFSVDAVAEVFARTTTPQSTSCFIDAACHSEVHNFTKAVAQLLFIRGASVDACTGALIGDRANRFPPYLLTAHHCIDTQAVAATVEATWDYIASFCGGSPPGFASLPRTNGAVILATSDSTDVSLLQLATPPSGDRSFLGWDPSGSQVGARLVRLSHPGTDTGGVYAQVFSTTIIDSLPASCSSPRPQFIFSQQENGGVGAGSSGAPAFDSSGVIHGQLLGGCGVNPLDGCSSTTRVVDGSFAQSYALLSPFLEDGNPAVTSCVPATTTACVLNNRFQVRVRVHNHFAIPQYDFDASVKPVIGFASTQSETAFFYFTDANNIEMLVKLLNAGNSGIAVLYGVATPFEVWLTITDTRSGAIQTYHTARDAQNGQTQFGAFPLDVPNNHADR